MSVIEECPPYEILTLVSKLRLVLLPVVVTNFCGGICYRHSCGGVVLTLVGVCNQYSLEDQFCTCVGIYHLWFVVADHDT